MHCKMNAGWMETEFFNEFIIFFYLAILACTDFFRIHWYGLTLVEVKSFGSVPEKNQRWSGFFSVSLSFKVICGFKYTTLYMIYPSIIVTGVSVQVSGSALQIPDT